MRVVADDDSGLLLWQPDGSNLATLVDADGNTPHELTPDRMREPRLVARPWKNDLLILMPPHAGYSVWWFFQDGTFSGWYVNLEAPCTRRPGGVVTTDHVLDLVVTPQRRWQWKDADEFGRRIGHPRYFDSTEAETIRAEGERLTKLIEAGEYPFDGTHVAFRPDPHWPSPRLSGDAE